MHECTAGPADSARPISILHVSLAKFAISFRMLLIAYFFYTPSLLREMDATIREMTGSQAPSDAFVIKLRVKVIKTLGHQPCIQSESFKL